MEKAREKIKERFPIAIIIVFFVLLHLMTTINYGDDIVFAQYLDNYGLVECLKSRYMTWSSRILCEAIIVILCRMPAIIWTTIDILMMVLLYEQLVKFIGIQKDYYLKLHLAALLCSYPFVHMGSAGWVATSVNYLWPLAIGMLPIVDLVEVLNGKKIKRGKYALDMLCLIFVCNQELMLGVVLCSFLIAGGILLKRKQYSTYPILGIIIACSWLIFILTTPGNAMRANIEIKTNMPMFNDLSLGRKLSICMADTMMHFVSIPNVLFFIFTGLLSVICFQKCKSRLIKIASCIPIVSGGILTAYYTYKKILVQHQLKYSHPSIICLDIRTLLSQGALVLGLIFIMGIGSYIVSCSISDKTKKIKVLLALGAGVATRLILLFSATMIASGTRTFWYMYIGIIIASVCLIEELRNKWIEKSLWVAYLFGASINVMMMWLYMQKY